MADAFEVFKIIIGVVIGVFFLYFMLNFSGLYSSYQQESIDVTHLKNFKTAIDGVYVTDTPVSFKVKIETLYTPPTLSLITKAGTALDTKIPIPFFYSFTEKDKNVIAYRESIDNGFTNFKFVGVLPETNIFYNILTFKKESFQIVNDLTNILPLSDDPRIIYGFCFSDDDYLTYTKTGFEGLMKSIVAYVSTNQNWKKEDLIGNRKIGTCTNTKDVMIIISDNESLPDHGFLIKPEPEDVGEVFYKESGQAKILVYKDSLDILAIITGGEDAYRYKNEEHLKFLEIAARSEIERAHTLSFEYQNSPKQQCSFLFGDAENSLKEFESRIKEMKTKPSDLPLALKYSLAQKKVKEKYKELESKGCI